MPSPTVRSSLVRSAAAGDLDAMQRLRTRLLAGERLGAADRERLLAAGKAATLRVLCQDTHLDAAWRDRIVCQPASAYATSAVIGMLVRARDVRALDPYVATLRTAETAGEGEVPPRVRSLLNELQAWPALARHLLERHILPTGETLGRLAALRLEAPTLLHRLARCVPDFWDRPYSPAVAADPVLRRKALSDHAAEPGSVPIGFLTDFLYHDPESDNADALANALLDLDAHSRLAEIVVERPTAGPLPFSPATLGRLLGGCPPDWRPRILARMGRDDRSSQRSGSAR